eukprot:396555-Alexandrium_andersonii.AAC.1
MQLAPLAYLQSARPQVAQIALRAIREARKHPKSQSGPKRCSCNLGPHALLVCRKGKLDV